MKYYVYLRRNRIVAIFALEVDADDEVDILSYDDYEWKYLDAVDGEIKLRRFDFITEDIPYKNCEILTQEHEDKIKQLFVMWIKQNNVARIIPEPAIDAIDIVFDGRHVNNCRRGASSLEDIETFLEQPQAFELKLTKPKYEYVLYTKNNLLQPFENADDMAEFIESNNIEHYSIYKLVPTKKRE